MANRTQMTHPLRSARPSADPKRWLRIVRDALERQQLPDAVVGMAVRVDSVTGNDGAQGDLFDRGFATAGAVETTLAQLADDHGELIVAPMLTRHPLADVRTRWAALSDNVEMVSTATATTLNDAAAGMDPRLTLQLLPTPRVVAVATQPRRDHEVPVRYRDEEGWHDLVDIAGPDRVSGGQWDAPYAREYFRCVRGDGTLVWLYRGTGQWYLHGWWD
jgi:hypothetical protein